MTDSSPAPAKAYTTGPVQVYKGMAHGMLQPSVAVTIRPAVAIADLLMRGPAMVGLIDKLRACGMMPGNQPLPPPPSSWADIVSLLARCCTELLAAIELPMAAAAHVLRATEDHAANADWSQIIIPVLPGWPVPTLEAWRAVVSLFDHIAAGQGNAALLTLTEAAADSVAQQFGTTMVVQRMVWGAYGQRIPVQAVSPSLFQFGQGRKSRWIEGSFTQNSSVVGSKLARNKRHTATRLRQAGLPVSPNGFATDADAAVRLAAELGYPVVIKPIASDGGRGVIAGIEDEAEVRKAFQTAREHSDIILVEKHFFGRDYRLCVFNGKFIEAVERVPAGVTGDGIHTVGQLVDIANQDPRRGNSKRKILKFLRFDDEAKLILARQGVDRDSVPAAGQFIRMNRIANISCGGFPVNVSGAIHPDNVRLAVRAAEAMRVDLAGVDLLIEDIAVSWHESGASICEVNAAPEMGIITTAGLYGRFAREATGSDGRIPVIAVLGKPADTGFAASLAKELARTGAQIGRHDTSGVWIGGEHVLRQPASTFVAGEMLFSDPHVDAAILSIDDDALLTAGLPCDRIDWLIVAGSTLEQSGDGASAAQIRFGQVIGQVLHYCRGSVINLAAAGVTISPQASGSSDFNVVPGTLQAPDAIKRIVRDLRKTLNGRKIRE